MQPFPCFFFIHHKAVSGNAIAVPGLVFLFSEVFNGHFICRTTLLSLDTFVSVLFAFNKATVLETCHPCVPVLFDVTIFSPSTPYEGRAIIILYFLTMIPFRPHL